MLSSQLESHPCCYLQRCICNAKTKSWSCFFHKTSFDELLDLLFDPERATPKLDLSYIGVQSLFISFILALFDKQIKITWPLFLT